MSTLTEIVTSQFGGSLITQESSDELVSVQAERVIMEVVPGYVLEPAPGASVFDPAGVVNLLSSGFRYINASTPVEGTMPYAKRSDVDGTFIYKAEAAPGSQDEDPVWRIWRIELIGDEGDLEERWAEGTAEFSFAWTDRLTLNYP